QTGRAHDEHGNHDQIDRQHLRLRKDGDGPSTHEADDQGSDERTAHAPEPADDDDGEGLDDQLDGHLKGGSCGGHHESATYRAEHAADGKDHGKDTFRIYAQAFRHVAIFRGGPYDASGFGPLKEGAEPQRDEEARQDDQEIVGRHPCTQNVDGAIGEIIVAANRPGRCSPEELEDVLENQQEAEGQQQLIALVAPVYRTQQQLDGQADETDHDPRNDQHRQEEQRRQAEVSRHGNGRDPKICAERIEGPAGQVEDLLDAKDELQPGGHEKDDGGVKGTA